MEDAQLRYQPCISPPPAAHSPVLPALQPAAATVRMLHGRRRAASPARRSTGPSGTLRARLGKSGSGEQSVGLPLQPRRQL